MCQKATTKPIPSPFSSLSQPEIPSGELRRSRSSLQTTVLPFDFLRFSMGVRYLSLRTLPVCLTSLSRSLLDFLVFDPRISFSLTARSRFSPVVFLRLSVCFGDSLLMFETTDMDS